MSPFFPAQSESQSGRQTVSLREVSPLAVLGKEDSLVVKKYVVYFIIDATGRRVKVGYTSDVEKRLSQLQTGNGSKLSIRRTLSCESEASARELEDALHKLFRKHGAHELNEWFEYPTVKKVYGKYASVVFKFKYDEEKRAIRQKV